MTTTVDIVNRALQAIGTRTTISSLAEQSNEAVQANLILEKLRDDLLRMAPWNCAAQTANLTLITSAVGTPENQSTGFGLWQKGLPSPPWAYEYQYPIDCLRPVSINPQFQTGFAGGVPITTAVTGGNVSWWQGPPVKFKVGIDQFLVVTGATVASGGTGYAVGDQITLAAGPTTSPPIGAPAVLTVVSVSGGGVITGVSIVPTISGESGFSSGFSSGFGSALGGSYFTTQSNPVAQGSTTGSGSGATFNLTFSTTKFDQRIILTNQEFATLNYIRQVIDPNVMDPLFQDAWVAILGARLAMALTGDKGAANQQIQISNSYIVEARKADANEGLTINDITPDFVRVRGISYSDYSYTPNLTFDWGAFWTPF